MGYIIPTEELTPTHRANFRSQAVEAGIARASTGPKAFAAREELISRAPQNNADFGKGAALDFWATPALAAVGTLYTVFGAIPNPQLANNRLAVFYKVGVPTAPIPLSLLYFQLGAAAGTTKDILDLEQLSCSLVPEGYFSEPIVYDPLDVLNIRVYCRLATGLLSRVILGGLIIEPRGITISG